MTATTLLPARPSALLALFAALALLLGCAPIAAAAEPTLAGRAFTLTVKGDAGEMPDRLVFNNKELTCKTVGKMPYTLKAKKKAISFDGTQTDDTGGTVAITGDVTGANCTGTITFTPKKGAARTLTFVGTDKPGGK
ncbi:MAG: hypothetical protein H0X38_15330 [Planctomycetes bacterium]|nr:hypothetical protein [Planctomycetota bacterium]